MFLEGFHDVSVVVPDFSTKEAVLGRQRVRWMLLLVQGMSAVTWVSGKVV